MKGCIDIEEPECTGSWCEAWGLCPASLDMMYEDSSVREEWKEELKRQGKHIPQECITAWRHFLRKKKRERGN